MIDQFRKNGCRTRKILGEAKGAVVLWNDNYRVAVKFKSNEGLM